MKGERVVWVESSNRTCTTSFQSTSLSYIPLTIVATTSSSHNLCFLFVATFCIIAQAHYATVLNTTFVVAVGLVDADTDARDWFLLLVSFEEFDSTVQCRDNNGPVVIIPVLLCYSVMSKSDLNNRYDNNPRKLKRMTKLTDNIINYYLQQRIQEQ